MPLSEPSWRVKRTPCPFYAKGNCVFSARCNFIHGSEEDETTLVEAEVSQPAIKPELKETPEPQSAPKPKRPAYKSGHDVSARLSDLLYELKSVIGNESMGDVEDPVEPTDPRTPPGLEAFTVQSGPSSLSSYPPPHSLPHDHARPSDGEPAPSIEEHPVVMHLTDSPLPQTQIVRTPSNHRNYSADLLSPVNIPDLHLRSFSRDFHDEELGSEASFATWATPGPMALSPPRSSARTSTFDLLSSPFGSPCSRIMSPHLAAFLNRIHPLSPNTTNETTEQEEFEPPGWDMNDLDSPDNQQHQSVHTVQPAARELPEDVFGPVLNHVQHEENSTARVDSALFSESAAHGLEAFVHAEYTTRGEDVFDPLSKDVGDGVIGKAQSVSYDTTLLASPFRESEDICVLQSRNIQDGETTKVRWGSIGHDTGLFTESPFLEDLPRRMSRVGERRTARGGSIDHNTRPSAESPSGEVREDDHTPVLKEAWTAETSTSSGFVGSNPTLFTEPAARELDDFASPSTRKDGYNGEISAARRGSIDHDAAHFEPPRGLREDIHVHTWRSIQDEETITTELHDSIDEGKTLLTEPPSSGVGYDGHVPTLRNVKGGEVTQARQTSIGQGTQFFADSSSRILGEDIHTHIPRDRQTDTTTGGSIDHGTGLFAESPDDYMPFSRDVRTREASTASGFIDYDDALSAEPAPFEEDVSSDDAHNGDMGRASIGLDTLLFSQVVSREDDTREPVSQVLQDGEGGDKPQWGSVDQDAASTPPDLAVAYALPSRDAQGGETGTTARWDSIGQDTALFVGSMTANDIDAAIRRVRPTDFLGESLESPLQRFNINEATTSSPTPPRKEEELDDYGDDTFLDESPTAQLAYLDDSNPQDDTLYDIYDAYSDMDDDDIAARSDIESPASSSPVQTFSESPQTLFEPLHAFVEPPHVPLEPTRAPFEPPPLMTPQSTLRRSVVFTPPPSRRRSTHSSASSKSLESRSLYHPWQSPFAVTQGVQQDYHNAIDRSPFIAPENRRGYAADTHLSTPESSELSEARGSTSQASAPDAQRSSKVPFGFRQSFVLGGARNSSLMLNRSSRVMPQEEPVETDDPALNGAAPVSGTAAVNGLKPLRLSTILTPNSSFPFASSSPSRSSIASHPASGVFKHSSLSSATVSSHTMSNKALLSHLPHISEDHINYTQPHSATPEIPTHRLSSRNSQRRVPMSAPLEPSNAWTRSPFMPKDTDHLVGLVEDNNEDYAIRRPLPQASPPQSAKLTASKRPLSAAVITPRPALMFAIASDDPDQVRQVLESGEAGPNDNMGPQSALAFTLANDQLTRKLDIVKVLLEYGADTSELQEDNDVPSGLKAVVDDIDEATRYYLSQADTSLTRRTSVLMRRSSFKPLARLRYGIVGQDRALEQLFRVLSMHNQKISTTPIVMLLCGPSGHGKSHLAQKFGSLLDAPTHTVNMTTLRSAQDLWQSYSIALDQNGGDSRSTLVEFLINNEGKRCVVVLDEIEKTQDDSVLWSLLLPWELGRCSFEANSMNIDVRGVVWLGTSNIGHDLIFSYHDSLKRPDEVMTRQEYVELMAQVRPRVSERLGASVLSRVTTILPFVPFTSAEKRVLASEALQAISSEILSELSKSALNSVVDGAVKEFIPSEGARSLYRAISSLVVDAMDLS